MSSAENYLERWQALVKEYAARADRLDAATRVRYNDWRNNLHAEFHAVSDWTEAAWEEFVAKAERTWHEFGLSDETDTK